MTATTDLAIPATVSAIDAATDREQVRQTLDDWRSENWNAWATTEAHARTEEADFAKTAELLHLLEADGSWRVDYLPLDLHHAELRALARLPVAETPAVYYRARD